MFFEIRKFPILRRVDNFFDKKWWFFRKILDMHVWSSISLSFAQKFAALKNLKLSKDATIRYKLDREKCRFTFAPVLAVHGPLAGFKPMIISKVKGTRWANQLRVETKKNCDRFWRVQSWTSTFSILRLIFKFESLDDRGPFHLGNGKNIIISEKESRGKKFLHTYG